MRTSARRRPRTSQRRSPPNSIARTTARSRWVRSADNGALASAGARIFGSVRGTRTNGTVRDRPPCRRVESPRGTGLTATGVSPRATRYEQKPDTDDGPRAMVRADSPDSRSTILTTMRSPRWWARKSNTSPAATPTGSVPTTEKNAFGSNATARRCSVGPGRPRTRGSGRPAGGPARSGSHRPARRSGRGTGTGSSAQAPSARQDHVGCNEDHPCIGRSGARREATTYRRVGGSTHDPGGARRRREGVRQSRARSVTIASTRAAAATMASESVAGMAAPSTSDRARRSQRERPSVSTAETPPATRRRSTTDTVS